MYKIEKTHLINKNWAKIYGAVNNDAAMVGRFIKMARKQKKIEAADLDTVLEKISSHITTHVEFSASGITFV